MIISIRGTNGSGKTTVAREIMGNAIKAVPLFGLLGLSKPEAYRLEFENIKETVHILGPYTSVSGTGFDGVTEYEHQPTLIRKYVARGHVIYEGLISGKLWGRIGALQEELADDGVGTLLVYLTTSKEECIRRVKQRRVDRGDTKSFNTHWLVNTHGQIVLSKKMILKREMHGIGVTDVSSTGAAEMILAMLETGK